MNPKQISFQNTAKTIIANLEKRNMSGYYCATKEDALSKALELITETSSVGWGGSMTMEEIGLIQTLKEGNYDAIDRMQGDKKEQATKIFNADWFFFFFNAIT